LKKNPSVATIPEEVIQRAKERLDKIKLEVSEIIDNAARDYKPMVMENFYFEVKGTAARASFFLPEDEIAFNSFLRKIKSIPSMENPALISENGIVKIKNIYQVRSVISELRPIFYNRKDSVYYISIHNKISRLLAGAYDGGSVKISVFSKTPNGIVEVTKEFINELNGRKKFVRRSLESSDLDYLYNGVLQHSDSRFDERHQKEYLSGEINFVILKNGMLLENLQECIDLYRPCIECLWNGGFPFPGSV
jgi:hypothetical protein